MHESSFRRMQAFRDTHLASRLAERLRVIDIGSQDVNGSYRPLFAQGAWEYVGVDMAAGRNVDIVLRNPYDWQELASHSADVVVSGQAFEHIEYFWISALEMARVLRPGGICCLIVPSAGPEHRYPVDCWRFYPDGLRAIARFAGLEVLQAETDWSGTGGEGGDMWHDSVLVARKPATSWAHTWRRHLLAGAIKRLARLPSPPTQ
ncbi:Methyltransferase domain protein [Tepidimonas fonticaldi]|uniref:Methyltransferase domain protein n=1 Tax=Tepidimonas fonticaldi TaxID=1101373 RepID=A0A554XIS7_9BURK|nr:methyltransferase domain-containing protein [Tepidimonas fonticaldi]TSE35698.1 Methyltransferase domain protein [Tepidimonas fonticaldi]